MKRTLSLCLAALLLTGAMASCGGGDTAQPVDTTGAVENTAASETEEPAYVPATVDMGGREFHILSKMEGDESGRWSAEDFKITEADGDVVNDAIFNRNQLLEEQFNCDIVNHFEPMGNLFSYTLYGTISKLVQAGDTTYDFMMPPIQDSAKLAADGILWDLTMFDSIKLDQPWWNQVFADATSIGGKSYYANGDISLTFMRAAYAILFSKNVLSKYDLDSPYSLVTDGKWTIDALMGMARSAAEDINGNGHMDSEDNIGMAMLYNSGEAFYAATGVKLVTVEDGKLTWTGDSAKSISVMEKIYDIYQDKLVTINCDNASLMSGSYSSLTNVDRGATFLSTDKTLFLFGTMNNVPLMRDMDGDFGILPLPWSASAATIPITAQDPEGTAMFMEAAAYYASQMITPAYYNVALKTKYARDDESQQMLDIIYENRWCDLGNLYNVGEVLTGMTSLVTSGQNTFASMMAKKESAIESTLEAINEAFLENE